MPAPNAETAEAKDKARAAACAEIGPSHPVHVLSQWKDAVTKPRMKHLVAEVKNRGSTPPACWTADRLFAWLRANPRASSSTDSTHEERETPEVSQPSMSDDTNNSPSQQSQDVANQAEEEEERIRQASIPLAQMNWRRNKHSVRLRNCFCFKPTLVHRARCAADTRCTGVQEERRLLGGHSLPSFPWDQHGMARCRGIRR